MAGSGSNLGFSASAFRDAIHQAMNMGLPNDASERITFVWDEARTYSRHSPDADPYDWASTPITDVAQRTLQVPAAVQWGLGTLSENPVGEFDTSKAVVTLLDVDYEQVKDANDVVINDVHYEINAVAPPQGLFDVTVYQLYLTARG